MLPKIFASSPALALSVLGLSGLLASCQRSGPAEPRPRCSVAATVRSLPTPYDGGSILVLDPVDSISVRLVPKNDDELWRKFTPRARNGQRVYIDYKIDSTVVLPAVVGALQPIRLTCLSAD